MSRLRRSKSPVHSLPPVVDWRTTDADEVLKRHIRAQEERPRIVNREVAFPVFSNFEVFSKSGLNYQVEIREVTERQVACTCTDFRINGLRTCKHVEAVFLHLARRHRSAFKAAQQGEPSPRLDVVCDHVGHRLRIERNVKRLPRRLRAFFDVQGYAVASSPPPEELVEQLQACDFPGLRISQEVTEWLAARHLARDRLASRRDYEQGVSDERQPAQETLLPLFPYQREGMLHLAFMERALLADEMGLGKTIQAVAACCLLHRLKKIQRVLVVTPVSLKTEWEEQIRKFTPLSLRLVFGRRSTRNQLYDDPAPPFFTIVNYEQIVADSLDINQRLRPDVVILDEAQRIKNWSTRTAQAVKRLRSRYAFVLTGTPIENRIDELRSIVDFLDPTLLGPLFRFNRAYYVFDDKGRPAGYQNLDDLRTRIQPILLRRRKAEVETELPSRSDHNLFIPLTPEMQSEYSVYEKQVADFVNRSRRRALTPKEQDLMMIFLNMMRMICDTPAIIKTSHCRDCPKLAELARILDECLDDPAVKVIVFSEWEGMLERVRDLAEERKLGYAWHTGRVSQQQRRREIQLFRADPKCRLFLSTDSGGVGLNLQHASIVINCDLPWNPAKLEQRIARAWRKNQLRPVTVFNLIAENTLEHGMLGSLADKQELASGVLDGVGDLSQVKLKRGRQDLLRRLEQVLSSVPANPSSQIHVVAETKASSDPAKTFAVALRDRLGTRLLRCDETWLRDAAHPQLITVVQGAANDLRPLIDTLWGDTPWIGPRPPLHVLDAGAWDALQRLAAAGLVTWCPGPVTRSLLGDSDDATRARPPLTPEQQTRFDHLRALAQRKTQVAQALLAANLREEALSPLANAVLAHAQSESLRLYGTEPSSLAEAQKLPFVTTAWPRELDPFIQKLVAETANANELTRIIGWLSGASEK